jgi:hypothetical protein
MTCKLCIENPVPQGATYTVGSSVVTEVWLPRKCAFDENGVFKSENWNCATMIELRKDIGDDWAFSKKQGYVYGDDQSCYVKHVKDGIFLILGWYKNRGRTEYAGLFCDSMVYPLALKAAEAILEGKSPLEFLYG